MSGVIGLQRRMMELGRVRLGEKGPKGEPRRLEKVRLTSASRGLLEAAAEEFGGEVREWKGAPDEGYFELYTDRSELPIVIPPVFSSTDGEPTYPFSQFYELWSGGGCQRRCDGVTEALSGKPCLCDPADRQCDIVTRFSFILPDVPGIGLWRMESGGINAAIELPATLEFLSAAAAEGRYIHAVLRLEQRSSKKDGMTRRFVVPVVDVPGVRTREMLSGEAPALNAPGAPPPRPALPEAPAAPSGDAAAFEDDRGGFGPPPPLPADVAPVVDAASAPKLITQAQAKKLNVLVGQLRDGGHATTEQVYGKVARMRNLPADTMIGLIDGARDADGVLHWSPLRDGLTRDEAAALIDALDKYQQQVGAGAAA